MRISVLENRKNSFCTEVTERVLSELQRYPCTVQVCTDVSELSYDADVALVLGGDGTLLHVAKALSAARIPVLGINLGRVGYLAELEPEELHLLSALFDGSARCEERMMLRATVRDCTVTALNDVVLANRGVSRLSEIGAMHNGRDIGTYLADGVIVATPTGSTAYSMSAGGSVLDPTLQCLSLTPICPVGAYAKPLIFSAQSCLALENLSESAALGLMADGQMVAELLPKERVELCCATECAYFLRLKQDSFCNTLRNKVLITGRNSCSRT